MSETLRAGSADAARVTAWARAAALGAWALIVLGGIVSATESGMGCGDHWPLCHGQAVPSITDPAVALEYGHRLVAGVVAALTVITAWRARALAGPGAASVRRAAALSVALVVVQSLLGATTVWLRLPVTVSTLHLATAELYFAILVGAVILSGAVGLPQQRGEDAEPARATSVAGLARLAAVTVALAYAVVVIGGYVKLSGAGLACGFTFPLCGGSALPDLSGRYGHLVLAHWLHRFGAFALAAHVLLLAARARRLANGTAEAGLTGVALVLVALQIALGVATVWTRLAPALSVLHLANATALLGVLAALAVRCALAAQRVPAVARVAVRPAPVGGAGR